MDDFTCFGSLINDVHHAIRRLTLLWIEVLLLSNTFTIEVRYVQRSGINIIQTAKVDAVFAGFAHGLVKRVDATVFAEIMLSDFAIKQV